MSGYMMPKEQYDFIKGIQDYMLESTNMEENEAWCFGFRIWQSERWLRKYMAEVSEDNEPTWEQVKEYCFKRNFAIVGREIITRFPEVSEDCISREWLEQEIEKFAMSLYKDEDYWKGWNEALEAILAQIELAPSVIPQQKEGEWIEREDWDGDPYYDCSICGESFVLIDGTPSMNLYHYCPNCGAKMKGAE